VGSNAAKLVLSHSQCNSMLSTYYACIFSSSPLLNGWSCRENIIVDHVFALIGLIGK